MFFLPVNSRQKLYFYQSTKVDHFMSALNVTIRTFNICTRNLSIGTDIPYVYVVTHRRIFILYNKSTNK